MPSPRESGEMAVNPEKVEYSGGWGRYPPDGTIRVRPDLCYTSSCGKGGFHGPEKARHPLRERIDTQFNAGATHVCIVPRNPAGGALPHDRAIEALAPRRRNYLTVNS